MLFIFVCMLGESYFTLKCAFKFFAREQTISKLTETKLFFTTYNFKFSYKSSLVKLFAMEEKKLGKAG